MPEDYKIDYKQLGRIGSLVVLAGLSFLAGRSCGAYSNKIVRITNMNCNPEGPTVICVHRPDFRNSKTFVESTNRYDYLTWEDSLKEELELMER